MRDMAGFSAEPSGNNDAALSEGRCEREQSRRDRMLTLGRAVFFSFGRQAGKTRMQRTEGPAEPIGDIIRRQWKAGR